jgi:phage recombination protein Bet
MTDTAVAVLSASEVLAGLRTVQSVLAPDLSPEELRLFAMVATRSGLDPFAKQIYAVKRKGRVTFQTGIDGYRSIAARTGMYDGQDEPEYGASCGCGDNRPAGHPESATVRVYRKGVGRPIAATAFWHEYKPEGGQSGQGDVMWTRMPRVMIAKVAEALALRKAFPYDPENRIGIGADLYTADEMAQAGRTAPAAETTKAPTLAERAKAKRAEVEAPQTAATEPEVDGQASFLEEPAAVIDLATTIREAAAASELDGLASAKAVKDLLDGTFGGWERPQVIGGIRVLFGEEAVSKPSAAQVHALELIGASMEPAIFALAWNALLETAGEPA